MSNSNSKAGAEAEQCTEAEVPTSSSHNAKPNVRRSFYVGDWVVYKPFENCREADVSGKGKIIEDFGDGMYRVTFGYTSIHGTRTGNFNWSNLWAV